MLAHAPGIVHSSTSSQCTSPSPIYPDLHLHRKFDGRLQHSAFSTQRAAIAGTSHSLISKKKRKKETKNEDNFTNYLLEKKYLNNKYFNTAAR